MELLKGVYFTSYQVQKSVFSKTHNLKTAVALNGLTELRDTDWPLLASDSAVAQELSDQGLHSSLKYKI